MNTAKPTMVEAWGPKRRPLPKQRPAVFKDPTKYTRKPKHPKQEDVC